MLPLAERLKRSNLFTKAYSVRKFVSTPLFTLYVLPRLRNTNIAHDPKRVLPMIGFVVSKKTCKSACLRNKIKRRLREAYRKLDNGNERGRWYAAVFVGKENVLQANWQDICRAIENAFSEAARRYG